MITTEIDRDFVGLDMFHEPAFLSPQFVTQADNVYVDGGVFRVRPGIAGALSEPLGSPLYEPTTYVDVDSATNIVFASGGKLYRHIVGETSMVEILDSHGASLSLDDQAVRMCRLGKYVYIVDGTGSLLRTDLATGDVVTGLNAPPQPAAATLASTPIDAMTSPGDWVCDTMVGTTDPPPNLFPNGDFATGISNYPTSYGNGDTAGGFTFTGPDVDYHDNASSVHAVPSGWSGAWALLDDAGEGFVTTDAIASPTVDGDTARYCRQFYVKFDYFQGDSTGAASVRIEVLAYSTTAALPGDLVGAQAIDLASPWAATQNQGQYLDHVFTFPDLGAEIASVRIGFYGGSTNKRGDGVFMRNLVLNAPNNALTASVTPGVAGLSIRHAELTDAFFGKVGGCRLRRDYGIAQDWSTFDAVAFDLANAADLVAKGLKFRLGLWNGSGTAHAYSNLGAVAADGSYVSFDISTVAARSSFRYVELIFMADLDLAAVRSPLLNIGPISAAGSLSVGYAGYSWLFTEIDDLGEQIESNPSPATLALAPTPRLAQGVGALPSPSNSAMTHYGVYRRGGTFTDTRFVAKVSVSADVATANYSWDHVTRSFTDNTPDSALYQADTLVISRDPPPTAAQAVAAWQGRLWVAVGSMLYASWLTSATAPAALYFTLANLPTADTLAVEGATFPIGGGDDDPIQAMVAVGTPVAAGNQFGGALLVLKKRSVWLVQGTRAADFSVRQYDYAGGVGLIAPRAVCRIDAGSVAFLGPDRVHLFPPNSDIDVSLPVQPLLFPRTTGETFANPAAIGRCWMAVHDRRIFVGVPLGDATTCTAAFVFDLRQKGWTVWKTLAATGAVSLPLVAGDASGYALALAGTDGQLSVIDDAAHADMSGPGADPMPISFALTSRAYTQRDWSFAQSRAVRAHVDIDASAQVTTTLSGEDPAQADAHPYTFGGRRRVEFKAARRVSGLALSIGIAGDVTSDTRVIEYGLAFGPSRQDR